ncbi:glycosyltransferase [Marinovum sp.]|uniref:glycosyltransferase n=1 Tax=Marinovum sp. TaxID=2024839 RepID=UPI003A910885
MHMIYEMRYSFFGRSGWQSEASTDKALLFDEARLDQRHYFLEKIALRSLADQSDGDFGLIVLSAEDLPDPHKARLQQVCGDMLGDRAHVIFRAPDSAGDCFTRYRKETFASDPWSTQIVLDDDDAVAVDFTERLRAEALAAKKLRAPGEEYCFISHARGISAVFRDGQMSLRHRLNAATNLGLAVTAPTGSRRQPFGIAHKKILDRRPVRVIYSRTPSYIRAVHETNDSKAQFSDRIVQAAEMDRMHRAFPLLRDLMTDWPIADAETRESAAA